MIRSRSEILEIIHKDAKLSSIYQTWSATQQAEFLDFCSGSRGVKILYDSFFKEILNPETVPERLNELLSLILKRQVKILNVLPNDSSRIGGECSLVIMDIVVELDDLSIANVEVQKLGYRFPGQRSACYSADLLLRQYKRVKGERGSSFGYRDIRKVYTIVFFEKSPTEFQQFPNTFLHHFTQTSDTGLKIDLLQEFSFISLDIFRTILQNKGIRNKLEAWLVFLCADEPEYIMELIGRYPEFEPLYRDIFELCRNIERVMNMFSKELQELDKNTVQYMIDEMQEEIDELRQETANKDQEIADLKKRLAILEK